MQIEEQNQAVEALETPPETDSTLIKKQQNQLTGLQNQQTTFSNTLNMIQIKTKYSLDEVDPPAR